MRLHIFTLVVFLLCLCFSGVSTAAVQNERNSLIAFAAEQSQIWDIYVMSPDGSNLLNLTNTPDVSELDPVWSPDGTRIAYLSFLLSGANSQIMVMDGRSHINISQDNAGDYGAVWSPDGRRIAFHSYQLDNNDIFVVNADGSNRRNLTNNPANDEFPAWSPDGRQILFSSDRDGYMDLFVMNADGTNPVNLTSDEPYQDRAEWSPDGNWIAYMQHDAGLDADNDLYLFGWPDASRVRLTDWEASAESSPSWSPDGTQLVYVSAEGESGTGTAEIFVLDIEDPDSPVQLTDNDVLDINPDWSPWLDVHDFYNDFLLPTTLTCPSAPPSRLHIGMSAFVAVPVQEGDERRDLRVRTEPGGEQIGSMSPGDNFLITSNPVCGDDDLMWWPVITLDGTLSGWSVEGFAPDDYLMIPYENG